MRFALSLLVLASLFVVGPAGGEDGGVCDLKTVEKGFCCAEHEILTSADLVSNVKYYRCDECADPCQRLFTFSNDGKGWHISAS